MTFPSTEDEFLARVNNGIEEVKIAQVEFDIAFRWRRPIWTRNGHRFCFDEAKVEGETCWWC